MNESSTFEEIQVGDKWTSPPRTVTEEDVQQFAGLTGDFDPLHFESGHFESGSEFQSPFGRPIAHGLLGLSLVAGLGSDKPPTATEELVSVHDWRFVGPIFFGDSVSVETEVQAKRPQGPQHGFITCKRRLLNQRGEVVQEGIFETLVRTGDSAEGKRADGPS